MSVRFAVMLLNWSGWVPLSGAPRDARIARGPGLYRVRIAGGGPVVYIGQTGNDLRRRLGNLSGTYDDEMPYRDPHTAAPGLWALRHRDACEFEASVLVVEGDRPFRLGMEAVAVSIHRQESGSSPMLNFGGMPAGYRRSSANNSALVRNGRRFRGGPDSSAIPVPGSASPTAPLSGPVTAEDWMAITWSEWIAVDGLASSSVGLYRFRRPDGLSLVYVGQGAIGSRVRAHARKTLEPKHRQSTYFAEPLSVSFAELPETSDRARLEIENDLIAAHMLVHGAPPLAQFLG